MKILKRINGYGEIFDTELPDMEAIKSNLKPETKYALHMHHNTSDLIFLRQYFDKGHPVFIQFEQSFYYVII